MLLHLAAPSIAALRTACAELHPECRQIGLDDRVRGPFACVRAPCPARSRSG